jgi:hypothetical protein
MLEFIVKSLCVACSSIAGGLCDHLLVFHTMAVALCEHLLSFSSGFRGFYYAAC